MRADCKLERTQEVDFRFQRADQGSKRADFRPYRTNTVKLHHRAFQGTRLNDAL